MDQDNRPAGGTPGAPDSPAVDQPGANGHHSPAGGSATGTETSGPTGGAEPHVPSANGEPEGVDLLDPVGGRSGRTVVVAVVAAAVVTVSIVWLVRRRRS